MEKIRISISTGDGSREELAAFAAEVSKAYPGAEVEALNVDACYAVANSAQITELKNRFTHHAPFGDQTHRYVMIRNGALRLAEQINHLTPKTREQSLAFTNLEQAVFWANAAIARNEKPGTMPRE